MLNPVTSRVCDIVFDGILAKTSPSYTSHESTKEPLHFQSSEWY